MTYEELEQAAVHWAQAHADILALLEIGSRARRRHPADEWSDLDLLVLTGDTRPYADAEWLAELGVVWLAYVEETHAGDPDVQAIFEGGIKGDFTFVTVADVEQGLDASLAELPYRGALSRGGRVLFNRNGPALPIPARTVAVVEPPTEQEYRRLIDGFWLYALRVAKFTSRGDLWRAMLNLILRLDLRLLTLIEWHARSRGVADTWYDGRFMAEWADPRVLERLPGAFAHYNAADLRRALLEAVALFRLLAQETAGQLGYEYPSVLDERLSQMVREA
jgi:aminoglycoside 6-adenylyltransferase